MSSPGSNTIARAAALSVPMFLAILVAAAYGQDIRPSTQAWILGTLTALLFSSEVFFWKSIDKVTELPQAETLSLAESRQLSDRVQDLKSRLIGRWFLLMGLKIGAGACAAWLANQSIVGTVELACWLLGITMLAISLPMALSFFRVWRQADQIQAAHRISARERKESRASLQSLDSIPPGALNADPQLTGYTKLIRSRKQAAEQK